MTTSRIAKVAFTTALLLAVGSALTFGPMGFFRSTPRVLPQIENDDYAASKQAEASTASAGWAAPSPLTRDRAWTYEVFTPPEIYYDEGSGRFTVTPLRESVAATKAGGDLELMAIWQVPFRLQLVGYVGAEGNFWGAFENVETSETILAREGQRLPELGLVITAFTVRRERVPIPDSESVEELVAVATVRDERNGTETVLTQAERQYTDQLRARLRSAAEPRQFTEAGVGEVVETSGVRYVVEKLELAPSTAVVRKEASEALKSERLTLSVAAALPP